MEALSRPVQQLRRPGPRWLQSGAAALKRARASAPYVPLGPLRGSERGGKLAAKGRQRGALCRGRRAAHACVGAHGGRAAMEERS